jgi:hypothetical protein
MKNAIYFFLITFFVAAWGAQAIETPQRGPIKGPTGQEHFQNFEKANRSNMIFDNPSTGSNTNPYQ